MDFVALSEKLSAATAAHAAAKKASDHYAKHLIATEKLAARKAIETAEAAKAVEAVKAEIAAAQKSLAKKVG